MSQLLLLALGLLVAGAAGLQDAGDGGSATTTTIKGVQALMYKTQAGTGGCYKLLNATGPAGCEGPIPDVDVPLLRLPDLPSPLQADVAVLVLAAEHPAFMQRWLQDTGLQQRVKGVLVDDTEIPASQSSLPRFPGAAYAPYPPGDYQWNLAGSDLAVQYTPLPVYRLSNVLARTAQAGAMRNTKHKLQGALWHARLRLPMNAHQPNASACLASRTCKPLGGYSVWSALPPLAANANITKPTVLVLAQVDSLGVFHDAIQGADAPLSGLVAMLVAAQTLQAHLRRAAAAGAAASAPEKQVVFIALAGEPWGYMGSRRLLWELEKGGAAVAGLDLGLVEQVIEVGQVGRANTSSTGGTRLYLHPGGSGGSGSLAAAVESAAGSLGTGPAVRRASATNPGLPPSSLFSFLRVKPSIEGLVIAEFDQQFSNPYYASRFDTQFSAAAVADTAALLATTLYNLAGFNSSATISSSTNSSSDSGAGGTSSSGSSSPPWQVNMTEVRLVTDALTSCLILPDPGLSCPAAAAWMVPGYSLEGGVRSYAPKHYVGILQSMHPSTQHPWLKDDVTRLIWNALAVYTASGDAGAACDPDVNVCPTGQVCVGWRGSNKDANLMGHCLNATTRYVLSTSTAITCANCDDFTGLSFHWTTSDEAKPWTQQHGWPPDPQWVESDWPLGVPWLQLSLQERVGAQGAVMAAGVFATVAAAAAAHFVSKAFGYRSRLHVVV